MKNNKKFIGYVSLKDARAAAREMALEHKYVRYLICVYVEKDGSYTVGDDHTKNAKLVFAIDKGGAKYVSKWVTSDCGRKYQTFVRLKDNSPQKKK